MRPPSTSRPNPRIKQAELLSSIGAGALGAGLALLFADALAPYKLALLLAGLAAHGLGMLRKHQLEDQEGTVRIWWSEALYWLCWIGLAGLMIFILARQL